MWQYFSIIGGIWYIVNVQQVVRYVVLGIDIIQISQIRFFFLRNLQFSWRVGYGYNSMIYVMVRDEVGREYIMDGFLCYVDVVQVLF